MLKLRADTLRTTFTLMGCFIFAEVLFLASHIIGIFNHYPFVFNTLIENVPLSIARDIIGYICSYLSLVSIFILLLAYLAQQWINYFNLSVQRSLQCTLFVTVLHYATLLLANAYLFPGTLHANLIRSALGTTLTHVLFYCCLISVILLWIATAVITLLHTQRYVYRALIMLIFFIIVSMPFLPRLNFSSAISASSKQPNIIIIGIDSLRLNVLKHYGASHSLMPHLDNFLEQGTWFANAVTPIAQTFPSWVSILTGMYPREHGARYDLISPKRVKNTYSMAYDFKRLGYETAFATDETRFSNIDHAFGFDHIIAPPMGANDFILGGFADLPLLNIATLHPWSRWLFPYHYGNRAASASYHPRHFLSMLGDYMQQQHKQPLFLAMHLCLSHWPFTWSEIPTDPDNLSLENAKVSNALFHHALTATDQQFKAILDLLKRSHVLDHAIVVVISDHGEAITRTGDRLTTALRYQGKDIKQSPFAALITRQYWPPEIDKTTGHGNDVLSMTQYAVLMAFRSYGIAQASSPRAIYYDTSLIDIKPTLMAISQYYRSITSGISLKPFLFKNWPHSSLPNTIQHLIKRPLFIETAYWPEFSGNQQTQHAATAKMSTSRLIEHTRLRYSIDPQSLRLHVTERYHPYILQRKQRAILKNGWILALYPATPPILNASSVKHLPVLVHLPTRQWTDDMTTSWAQHSPAAVLRKELQHFYQDEVTHS